MNDRIKSNGGRSF